MVILIGAERWRYAVLPHPAGLDRTLLGFDLLHNFR
jgi:hypothetical protein